MFTQQLLFSKVFLCLLPTNQQSFNEISIKTKSHDNFRKYRNRRVELTPQALSGCAAQPGSDVHCFLRWNQHYKTGSFTHPSPNFVPFPEQRRTSPTLPAPIHGTPLHFHHFTPALWLAVCCSLLHCHPWWISPNVCWYVSPATLFLPFQDW